MLIAKRHWGTYVFANPSLHEVRDRLQNLIGVTFRDLSNKYREEWVVDDGGGLELTLMENFDLETEHFHEPDFREYPVWMFFAGVDNPDALDALFRSDPELGAVRACLHLKGEDMGPPRVKSRVKSLEIACYAIDSRDLDGIAAWLAERFDIPLERYESKQWGPYYTVFNSFPASGPAPGRWELWIDDNPVTRPGLLNNPEYGHPDLLLRVGPVPDFDAVETVLLSEFPVPIRRVGPILSEDDNEDESV